jgi:hypothetical protein
VLVGILQKQKIKKNYLRVKSLFFQIDLLLGLSGAGVMLTDFTQDDTYGHCGCGTLPYLRLVAELLNTRLCDPGPCPYRF